MPDRFRRGPTSTWKTGWVTVALRLGLDPVRTYARLRRPGGFSKALWTQRALRRARALRDELGISRRRKWLQDERGEDAARSHPTSPPTSPTRA